MTKKNILFDTNIIINDDSFDFVLNNIKQISNSYNLLFSPYQIFEVSQESQIPDHRREEKISFIKSFHITYDINVFPMLFGVKFCTDFQLRQYYNFVYCALGNKGKDVNKISIDDIYHHINNYKYKHKEKKMRDCRIFSIAYFEDAICVSNDKDSLAICKDLFGEKYSLSLNDFINHLNNPT
jgi:hypothetical protein